MAKVSVDNNCRKLGAELEPLGVEYIDTEIFVLNHISCVFDLKATD